MSQRAFLADLDADLHIALADAGMADTGTYTAPGAARIDGVRMYVDKGVQDMGTSTTQRGPRVLVTLLRADVATPVRNAVVELDGERWRLVSPTENVDDGVAEWVVEAANV